MKKVKLLIAASAVALVFTACDKDNDTTTNNNTNEPANATDVNFVAQASTSNQMEIAAGQEAASRATNTGVRSFGQMMVSDHTTAQSQLQAAASRAGLTATADSSGLPALRNMLSMYSGRAFDSVYINMQVAGHQQTLSLLQTEATVGVSSSLKAYANAQIPIVQMHLKTADSLRRTL